MHKSTDVAGEEVDVDQVGVRPEDLRSLKISIRTLTDINASSVRIDDGVLTYTINVGKLTGRKRDRLIDKTNATVVAICQHKADVPERGVTRRKKRDDRYVNRSELFASRR